MREILTYDEMEELQQRIMAWRESDQKKTEERLKQLYKMRDITEMNGPMSVN
jgi:membrane protein insertase Oxa1/YidC/SpoIIIJ